MAGRFVIQKLVSGISRSRSPLRAHAPAFVRAGDLVIATPPDGGIRTLGHLFHGDAVLPGYATTYLSLFTYGRAGARSSSLTTNNIPSPMVKKSFSSNASSGHDIPEGAKRGDWQAQWAAVDAELAENAAGSAKFLRTLVRLSLFACCSCILGVYLDQVDSTGEAAGPKKAQVVPAANATVQNPKVNRN